MNRTIGLTALLLFVSVMPVRAQQARQNLSLKRCYQLARENHPVMKQSRYYKEVSALQKKNAAAGLLPRLSFAGMSRYQSDVTSVSLDMPRGSFIQGISIPEPDKDQHSLTLQVDQVIFDGNIARYTKEYAQKQLAANLQAVEVSFLEVKQSINRAYFGLLFSQEKVKLLKTIQQDLYVQRGRIASMVKNGLLLEDDLDAVDARVLENEAGLYEAHMQARQSAEALEKLTGAQVTGPVAVPDISIAKGGPAKNPALLLFERQITGLETAARMENSKRLPIIAAYARAGYGKPGLNMLSNTFDTYYTAGIQCRWNMWDWGVTRRRKQQLSLKQNIIASSEAAWSKGLAISFGHLEKEIDVLRFAIESDRKLVAIRTRMQKRAESQLSNGTITTAEYIRQLSDVQRAEINLRMHEIELLQKKAAYQTLKGEL